MLKRSSISSSSSVSTTLLEISKKIAIILLELITANAILFTSHHFHKMNASSSDPNAPSNNGSNGNSLNPNDYNPISNLDQQYANAPLGRRIILIIKLNESCIVPGGVDTVLKYAKASGSPVRSASGTSLSGMNGGGGGGGSSTVDGVTMTVADPSLHTALWFA